MSTAVSPRWDEVPAVAGVGSIQKRQQSAPPYYVFSSDPTPRSSPRCFSSRESNPPPLPVTAPLLRCAPPTSPPLTVLSRRNGLLLVGRSQRPEVLFTRSALIEDDSSLLLLIAFYPAPSCSP